MEERTQTTGCKLTMNLMFSCFGVSLKRVVKSGNTDDIVVSVAAGESSKVKKMTKEKKKGKKRWLSSSYLRLKRPTGTSRTVPVDIASSLDRVVDLVDGGAAEKRSGGSEMGSPSNQKDNKSREDSPPRLCRRRDDDGQTERGNETREDVIEDVIDDRNHIHKPIVESPKNDRWQRRRPFDHGVDAIRGGSTAPEAKMKRESPPPLGAGYESLIGMSIIMMTGLITIVWGRVCAIMFTCAWLYIVSHLRKLPARQRYGFPAPATAPGEPDIYSKEYKEKVVLEGLLARSRRPPG